MVREEPPPEASNSATSLLPSVAAAGPLLDDNLIAPLAAREAHRMPMSALNEQMNTSAGKPAARASDSEGRARTACDSCEGEPGDRDQALDQRRQYCLGRV